MVDASAHFSKGTLPVAFIFSAPGEVEAKQKRPIAGSTGENLDSALEVLNLLNVAAFPSRLRYDYRITNSWAAVLSSNRGDKRTEPRDSQVREIGNIERIKSEVSDCCLIILCGNKPALLSASLSTLGRKIVVVPHIGNKALNRKYVVSKAGSASTPLSRRAARTKLWAQALLTAINSANVA